MEINELRINNLIKYKKGHIAYVKEIRVSHGAIDMVAVKGVDSNYIDGIFEINNFEPIPITEELLLKLGFKLVKLKDSSFQFIYINYYAKDGVLLFFNDGDLKNFKIGFGEMREGNYFATTIRWIKYAHEIQNIYFALTGEELKWE